MHAIPRLFALITGLLLVYPAPQANAQAPARFGKPRIVSLSAGAVLDENSTPVVSADGEFGFVSSAPSGSLYVFSVSAGRVISSRKLGDVAGLVSMAEVDSKRVLAVPTTKYAGRRGSVAVHLLNATNPAAITAMSDVELPPGADIVPSTAAPITSDGRFGVIATGPAEPRLFSFSVESGRIVSEISLQGWPTAIALSPPLPNGKGDNEYCVAVISNAANALSLIQVDQTGRLTIKSGFVPARMHFEPSNNVGFSPDGRTLYVAVANGREVLSISVEDGSVLDTVKMASMPHRLTVVKSTTGGDLIAVTRIDPGEKARAAVSILESRSGRLTVKSEITMPQGADLSPESGVVFNRETSLAFVGAPNGALMGFNLETGALDTARSVGAEFRGFVESKGNLIGVRSSSTVDEIAVVPLHGGPDEAGSNSAPTEPEITGVNGDGEYLRLVIDGSNFSRDAAVELVRGGRVLSRRSPLLVTKNQVVVLIPASEIETIGRFDVRVTDVGAGSSNAVAADAATLLFPGRSSPKRAELAQAVSPRDEKREPEPAKRLGPDRLNRANLSEPRGGFRSRRVNRNQSETNIANSVLVETEVSAEYPTVRARRVGARPGAAVGYPRKVAPIKEEALQISGTSQFVTPEIVEGSLRFVVHAGADAKFKEFTLEHPSRIVLDIARTKGGIRSETIALRAGPVERVRVGQPTRGVLRVVLDVNEPVRYAVTRDTDALIVTIGTVENASLKWP